MREFRHNMTLPVEYRDRFIEGLMETGSVCQAAARVGANRLTFYRWREEDEDFAERWEAAMEVARSGLRERVVETASAIGLARQVPLLDEVGDPVLDENFDPVTVADTSHVDARVLMKLMDKTMRDEVRRVDSRALISGRFEHTPPLRTVVYDVDGNIINGAREMDEGDEEAG